MISSLLVIMEFTSPRHQTICAPFPSKAHYRQLITKGTVFRNHLDKIIAKYPKLFPSEITSGYWLHGSVWQAQTKPTQPSVPATPSIDLGPSIPLPPPQVPQ